MVRTEPQPPTFEHLVRTPTVLAVLVVNDGMAWLRQCLQGLSGQSYPRLGVVAVDTGSRDGSLELLEQALGAGRVLSLERGVGLAGAVAEALDLPAAAEAEFLLIVHDDTVLETDSVEQLVDAASTVEGTGILGPKVVDWDDPRVLREVGRSTDRFGHAYTPLQDGEFDHGQYDRVLEVLFVSSCAMLVRRETWQKTGALDERLGGHHEDLDFCWRARLAGFRVVMTPLARVRHYGAARRGRRAEPGHRHTERYHAERASIASMLKNYSIVSLLWILPVYAVVGLGRLMLLAASRRFEDAYELLSAWGWNLRHLVGTVRRRMRAQSVRTVRDRDIRRFMESTALRVPRWLEEASAIIVSGEAGEDEGTSRLRARAGSLVGAHPMLMGTLAAAIVVFFAGGRVFGAQTLGGGVLAGLPPTWSGFLHELTASVRSTRLGGAQPGSPALAPLAGLSWLSFGDPSTIQRILLIALPVVAGVMMYRAVARRTSDPSAAIVAAGAYGLAAVMLWAFSQGRLELLVVLGALPVIVERLAAAFDSGASDPPLRVAAGVGVATAIAVACIPGVVLAVALVVLVRLVLSTNRIRGAATSIAAVGIAAALILPMIPEIVGHPAAALGSLVGEPRFASLVRLVLGPAPGAWHVAWFLPVGAVLSLAVVAREHRAEANRLAVVAVAAIFLAWLSAAGWLPSPLSNAIVYVALAAVAEAFLVGFGVSALVGGIAREAFGLRQVLAGGLTFVLTAGIVVQAFAAMTGRWEIRQNGVPPAWPVVADGAPGDFRVLWLRPDTGDPLPAPGGDPMGAVGRELAYSVTDRDGAMLLDVGRAAYGPGYGSLEAAVGELLSGSTTHVGALLAPFGVRFVVAPAGSLPEGVTLRLDEQVDLDRVPALGLTIYRNPVALPVATQLPNEAAVTAAVRTGRPGDVTRLVQGKERELRPEGLGWAGQGSGGGPVYLADQLASGWRLRAGGRSEPPARAFGWAMRFPQVGGPFELAPPGGLLRIAELWVLALAWAVALWITRKPVRSQ